MLVENMRGQCWHCGHDLQGTDYNRESYCPACGKANHSCKNCNFYQPGIGNDCREPMAERVTEKERANFCDYFEPGNATGTDTRSAEDALAAAEDLFN